MIWVVAAVAAVVAIGTAIGRKRLSNPQTHTLSMTAVLIAWFAVWTALLQQTAHRSIVGVALFAGSIVVFKLMGRFEQPPDR
jgi:uncharacterized membrane protein YgdD (TMEM256/DUF423 family)